MIKLTKTQKEIEVLAQRVPHLTDEQREWARKHFNYYRVVKQGMTATRCPDCNCIIDLFDNNTKREGSKWCKTDYTITCPHCGATIQIRTMPADYKVGSGWNRHQEDFFQVMDVVGGWQVTRLFYMNRYCYVRKENTPWAYYEVCQAWNHPSQKKTHFRAFPKTMMMNHPFCPYKIYDWRMQRDENGDLTYARDEKGYFIGESVPCQLEPRRAGGANYFDTTAICPNPKILPAYRQRGINMALIRKIQGHRNAMWLFECLSSGKPMYETLLKANEYEMFYDVTIDHRRGDDSAEKFFSAWKICQRTHYDIHSNYTEWMDYVQMLIDEGKDIRNPHFVCPSDLHEAHQAMLERKRRAEERERERIRRRNDELARIAAEEAMKDAVKAEKDYVKAHKRFFDIVIPSEKFTIVVLKTINDFKEEGLALHHCVFRAGYYRKAESLLLSARDEDNNPIETIEVDLNSLGIRQCYGNNDTFTPLHNSIVETMNANMWRISDCKRA